MTELRTIQANGINFSYFEEGSGPLVLLMHGFPDTAHTWDETRPALARAGYRVVAPFTRGYAPTSAPAAEDYSAETLGKDIAELIVALGESSAIVVGHDWGAAASYAAAILYPERVRFLVTVAIPHPASLKPSLSILWKVRHFLLFKLPGAAARTRKNNFQHIDELVHRWSPAWQVPPGETDAVKRSFSQPGSLEAALGYYRALQLNPPASQQAKIKMPAIAFAGATDFALKPEAYERARRFYLDRYDVVTLPGGHFLHREHPEEFNRELIARLPRP